MILSICVQVLPRAGSCWAWEKKASQTLNIKKQWVTVLYESFPGRDGPEREMTVNQMRQEVGLDFSQLACILLILYETQYDFHLLDNGRLCQVLPISNRHILFHKITLQHFSCQLNHLFMLRAWEYHGHQFRHWSQMVTILFQLLDPASYVASPNLGSFMMEAVPYGCLYQMW